MKVWYDLNMNIPSDKKKFFQFSKYSDKYTLVGIEKHDGQGAITLKPGDIIQLTEMEIAANEQRIIFREGIMVEISEDDVRKLVEKISTEKEKILSDVEIEDILTKSDAEITKFINNCDNKINIKKLYNAMNQKPDVYYKYIKILEQKDKSLNNRGF